MSEGELKKRVRKAHWALDSPIQKEQAVIDEAKKDFPAENGFGFNEDGTKIYDIYDWFKKWFGDQK